MLVTQQPEEEKNEQSQSFRAEKYQGILPHPDHIERLHNLNPEYVSRAFTMAEGQLKSAERDRSSIIAKNFWTHLINNLSALIGAGMILFVGAHFMHKGNPEAGASIIVSTIVGFGGIFIIREWKKDREKDESGGKSEK